jgi:GntR family transcriptional regulator, histidine utilization repressor
MDRSVNELQPLYLKVKRHILDNIGSGKWATSARVPSENDIVKSFGVSRMTANRALRELRDEGVLVRIAGVGSFVADRHAHAHPLEIRSIADEIRGRGHVHRAEIVSLERIRAVAELAEDFGIAPRSELYCSVIVHFENDRPVQLEDRYVLPKLTRLPDGGFPQNHALRIFDPGGSAARSRAPAACRNAGRAHSQTIGHEAR